MEGDTKAPPVEAASPPLNLSVVSSEALVDELIARMETERKNEKNPGWNEFTNVYACAKQAKLALAKRARLAAEGK